jgi:hypothetical protein
VSETLPDGLEEENGRLKQIAAEYAVDLRD